MIILNKDGVTENLDPPHNYADNDGHDGNSDTPTFELRPYQEVDTDDRWSTDPKVFAAAVDAAVDAHEAHSQNAGMLKAQCASKLCNFADKS